MARHPIAAGTGRKKNGKTGRRKIRHGGAGVGEWQQQTKLLRASRTREIFSGSLFHPMNVCHQPRVAVNLRVASCCRHQGNHVPGLFFIFFTAGPSLFSRPSLPFPLASGALQLIPRPACFHSLNVRFDTCRSPNCWVSRLGVPFLECTGFD